MDSDTITQILAVDIPADKKLEILAILNTRPERSKGAARMARYRAKRHISVTSDVTSDATCDVTEVTLPSPPSPPLLSPAPPILPAPAPTPMQAQGARGACESEESQPPHKRIRWDAASGWTGIEADDWAKFKAAAPAVDIDRALSATDLWLRANPSKAKKQNFYRFFTNWIARNQERGGDATSAAGQKDRNGKPPVRHSPDPNSKYEF